MKTEIEKYNPCEEAVIYRKQFKTFEEAWENCPRGDWMLWIAAILKINIRTITLAKGYCAKTVIHLMKDERSRNAVKTAIRYGRYKASKDELDADADAAYAAAYAAADADAANAAAYAAYAANAANAAAYAAARKQNQLETANICRKYLTEAVYKKIL